MTKPENILASLRQLAELDNARRRLSPRARALPEMKSDIAAVRERLPTALLGHYDQRQSRGKPGIAPVRRGVCGACHLALPSGSLADMLRGDGAIQVCGNCGVFIYLAGEEAVPAPPSVPSRKKTPVSRKQLIAAE